MVFDMLVEQLANHVLDFAHARIAKLKHLPTIQANEVGLFVFNGMVSKIVPSFASNNTIKPGNLA